MNTTQQEIVNKTAQFIEDKFQGEGTGHDWHHIYRVWKSAENIAKTEDCDPYIVSLAALLHDIADHKFYDGDLLEGSRQATKLLTDLGADEDTISKVADIVKRVSFKGAKVKDEMPSIEGKVVQDADRLDAIGAIGIARAFAYGGSKHRLLYDPEENYEMHDTFDAYHKNESSTIAHFYEKLLLLKDRMHTNTAKQVAEQRHRVMEDFLQQFYGEWEGKK
ncbi:HD domain-containing protein [Flammeovirga agarivorans]|uniref:HD domain-containing protein n=1 Tax=Flammeovirga agarivorans TaxID=2726742 RepID=A0A7X8XU50_9BACT|nr:HD domain-containing protein [Flammeovirga agarivorans]NLR89765.1 HD domain-containing protein [Flammeovirga agarivorans]